MVGWGMLGSVSAGQTTASEVLNSAFCTVELGTWETKGTLPLVGDLARTKPVDVRHQFWPLSTVRVHNIYNIKGC